MQRALSVVAVASFLIALGFAPLACADKRSPDQRELDELLKEAKQLDADIAAEERIAGQTQDTSNAGELDALKDKREALQRRIDLVKERIHEGGAGS